jgi:hypothetical protein
MYVKKVLAMIDLLSGKGLERKDSPSEVIDK